MNVRLYHASMRLTTLDRNHVRLAIAIGALLLVVIGAAAPDTCVAAPGVDSDF